MSRLDEIRKFLDDMPEQRKLIAQGYRWGQKYQEDIPYLLSLVERLASLARAVNSESYEELVCEDVGEDNWFDLRDELLKELEGKDD